MPALSEIARRKKATYFLDRIKKGDAVLEIGAGSQWVRQHLVDRGTDDHYRSMDIVPPADIVGDINTWPSLGLREGEFDAIVAFEVVEHVDCFAACFDLLKPGGEMLITTPVPSRDWVLKIFEALKLNQKRTSPHDHLIDLRTVAVPFASKQVRLVGGLSQWAIFTK